MSRMRSECLDPETSNRSLPADALVREEPDDEEDDDEEDERDDENEEDDDDGYSE